MARVLGISAHYHDAAAALVIDGQLVAAIQQERLSRIKNDPSLPFEAARACLEFAAIEPGSLDAVVFYERPFDKLERVLVNLLRHLPRTWRQFPRALASQLGDKLWVLDQLAEEFDVPRDRVICHAHHRCHAASALLLSPYDDAAALVVDGVGEHCSTSLWHGRGAALRELMSVDFPHSLGLLYAGLTAYLGFAVNEGEYKVMGLAAWGAPRLRDEFDRIIRLRADGSYELGLEYFAHMSDAQLGFGPALERLLGPRRPPGRPWALDSAEDRRYADVAATLQQVLEEALLGLCRRARAETGSDNLCLAGGVALNALANARIQRESGFARVFVQPAAGDAGGALGAALLTACALGDPRPPPLGSAALGLPVDVDRCRAVAGELGLATRRVDDPAAEAAALLVADRVVAHVRGRFEWGPRALGQRSILARPHLQATRDRLNRVVKRREPFRPFAPAVLSERTVEYFNAEPDDMTPFMTTVARVRDDRRDRLAAVTHEDGTARLQTVEASRAPELHAVLAALDAGGADPVVLNTSLNGPGEPIVASAEDALAFWLRHGVDALVVEDLVIERTP
ncbi:MAG: carbamoyltransferase N-terminal domain-containing protein [Nannocystaceae bacterium]|nr:hypothetical protein [Myxococcales bacterium]